MAVRCLAYLLDTPVEPGVVVTYRCTRLAGHAEVEHEDGEQQRTWAGDSGVVWAAGAVFPVHTGWPWDEGTPPPPLETSETSVSVITAELTALPPVGWSGAGQTNTGNGTVYGG